MTQRFNSELQPILSSDRVVTPVSWNVITSTPLPTNISRFSVSDRKLTNASSLVDVADYDVLRPDDGMVNGSPVGLAVLRNSLSEVVNRSTVHLADDFHPRMLDMVPPTSVRGGYIVDHNLVGPDLGIGQSWLGNFLDSSSDFTVALKVIPRQNGAFFSWDTAGIGILIITQFSGQRVYVRLNAGGGSTANLAGPVSNIMTLGQPYWIIATYAPVSGAVTLRVYQEDGTLVHNGSAVSLTGIDCSGIHRLGCSGASVGAGDIECFLVYNSVLSTVDQDAIVAGSIGTPSRDYSSVYSGVYNPSDLSALYYSTGTGYPVRVGDHPQDDKLIVLTGQSNALGSGTTVDPTWNLPVGRMFHSGLNEYKFDTTPGLEHWLINGSAQSRDPLRAIYINGFPGTNIASHVSTYGPQMRIYLSTDSVVPKAVLMWQGEADSDSLAAATAFQGRAETYVADWRAVYPNIPIIWIGPIVAQTSGGSYDYADTVRTALSNIVLADSNFYYIDTSASGLNLSTSDGIHANNAGMAVLAATLETLLVDTLGIWTSSFDPLEISDTISFDSVTLEIENNVTPTDKYLPLTGIHAVEEEINGWQWDRRRTEDSRFLETQYDTFLGGHSAGLRDGTYLAQWQSGTLRDTQYVDLQHYRKGEFLTWTPRVQIGGYSLFHDERSLLSDYSYQQLITTDSVENGVMYHELRDDAVTATIDIGLYVRDDKARIFKKVLFERVEEFSGVFESGVRKDTVDSDGNILWDNVDNRKPEFIVKDGRVWLNDDYSISVGVLSENNVIDPVPGAVFDLIYQNAGSGVGEGRSVFSKVFPLQPGSVRLFSKDAADNVLEWTEQDNLNFSLSTDKHFSVDYDLGIIETGGFQAPDLFLSEEVQETDIEISVYLDPESMDQYPAQGIIVIGTEQIAYYGRTRDTFYNLIRGFNGTFVSEHPRGSLVSDIQHGMSTSDELYVSFVAIPRIEYEVTPHDKRSANKSTWLDVRPGVNVETNNIVQILSADISLKEVVLETDTPLIGGRLHGPTFYGTDVSRLTARAIDALDNPVEDLDLTISIISGAGLLNGSFRSFTDITNTLGEIYAFYNSPYDKDSIEKFVSDVSYDGADTLLTVDGLEGNPVTTDIWVYQVLKHDPVTGSVGTQLEITAQAVSTDVPGAAAYVDVEGVLDEYYKNGYLYVIGSDGITYLRNIIHVEKEYDINDQPYSRVYIHQSLSAVVVNQTARFYQPDAVEWNPAALNGVRRIVYEWRDDVVHPITNELGAFYPLQPDTIEGNVLRFSNRQLAIPDKNDPGTNLGAYVVVAPGKVQLQAHGRDPMSGRVVQSNIIELNLELPSSLVGVDSTGALPIPYGWTLVSEEFNIGTGIGGANFITINPAADGINQFNISGVI